DDLRELSREPKVVDIGEIGLDFYRNHAPADRQLEAFRAQIGLAGELDRPIVVHNRSATTEVLATIEEFYPEHGGDRAGVLHCFTEGAAVARRAIARGFFVSFAGILTYPKSEDLRATSRELPID